MYSQNSFKDKAKQNIKGLVLTVQIQISTPHRTKNYTPRALHSHTPRGVNVHQKILSIVLLAIGQQNQQQKGAKIANPLQ